MDDYQDYQNQTMEEEKIDDEMGVAVVFDDSDDEAEEGHNLNDERSDVDEDEVVEVASTSSSEAEELEEANSDDDDDEEKIVIDESSGKSKKVKHAYDRVLSVHEIDAHYLQRQLSAHYDDANVCSKLANEVLDIIDISSTNSSDLRECENKLLVLLESELFDVIKCILNNRVRIWACVSLKRAKDDDERDAIENILKNEPTGEGIRVLEEIHTKNKAEDWSKDRMRGITESFKAGSKAEVSSALDSIGIKDTEMEDANDAKKGEEAIELDLETLAFRDGAHTMTNKKCNLPDKSWRAMKKGYEEVHVPAVRSIISKDEKLVPIKELPQWTHDAFKGMEKLNRVQSKMCEVALRSSENILLCAPTGAGKTVRILQNTNTDNSHFSNLTNFLRFTECGNAHNAQHTWPI